MDDICYRQVVRGALYGKLLVRTMSLMHDRFRYVRPFFSETVYTCRLSRPWSH